MTTPGAPTPEKINHHCLKSIIAFILFPPLWFLSVPALIFSAESKRLYELGAYTLAFRYADRANRFSTAAWLISLIIAGTILLMVLLCLSGLL